MQRLMIAKNKVRRLENELQSAQKELAKEKGKIKVTCTDNFLGKGCYKAFPIKKLTFIQQHYYVLPFGCTEGDYWLPSEGSFLCPDCGHKNRFHKYDRPEMLELKPYFGKIENYYPR